MAQQRLCNTKIQKSRGWTITINNYDEDDIKAIQALDCEHVFQEETGENGTPHIQGMLYFKNAVAFNTVKKALPTAHIEKMKNKIASIKYCSKKDTRTGEVYSNIDIGEEIDTVSTPKVKKVPAELEVKKYIENIKYWGDIKLNRPDLWEKYKEKIDVNIRNSLENLDEVDLNLKNEVRFW